MQPSEGQVSPSGHTPNIVLGPIPVCKARSLARHPSGSWSRSGDSMSIYVNPALSVPFTAGVGKYATFEGPAGMPAVSPAVPCVTVGWCSGLAAFRVHFKKGSCSLTRVGCVAGMVSCVRNRVAT